MKNKTFLIVLIIILCSSFGLGSTSFNISTTGNISETSLEINGVTANCVTIQKCELTGANSSVIYKTLLFGTDGTDARAMSPYINGSISIDDDNYYGYKAYAFGHIKTSGSNIEDTVLYYNTTLFDSPVNLTLWGAVYKTTDGDSGVVNDLWDGATPWIGNWAIGSTAGLYDYTLNPQNYYSSSIVNGYASGNNDGVANGQYAKSFIIANTSNVTTDLINTRGDTTTNWSISFNITFEKIPSDLNGSTIVNMVDAINSYLSTCELDSVGNCQVPIIFHSDSAGVLETQELEINYTITDPTTVDFADTMMSELSTCTADANFMCSIPLNISSNSSGTLELSDFNLSYEGDWRSVNDDVTEATIFEEAVWWRSPSSITNYSGNFTNNYSEGEYDLGVTCNDTTNSVLTLSNISTVTVTGVSIALDGLDINRTYEYGSVANVTIVANDSLNTCANVYILGYGIDYACSTDSSFSFLVNLSDYVALDYFTTGISNILHYFRVKTYSMFNATMPNYIDILEGSLDLTGNYSESTVTYFNDWETNQTEETYDFVSNENTLLNMSFRSAKEVQSAYFSVYSTEASVLYIDICNDGSVDTTATSTFFSTTPIQLDIEAINNCTNESLDISVVPFALNFTTGGNVTISVVDFVLSEQVYPEDITLDVNNDELVDFSLPGELVGQLGAVSTFSDGDTSKDFSSNTSTVESFMFNISVPRNLQYTTYTIALSSISDTDLFDEDFKDNDYINTSTTTANVETFWGQVKNGLSAGSPTESWIYSKEIPSYVTNITSITNIVSTDEDNTNAATYFWLSSNNGTNWTEMEENDDTTIAVPGDHVYWKARLTTDTLAYAYIYNLELTGLGYAPTNLSIDVGNDGSLDWNITGRYSGDLTDIVLDSDTIEAAISGCNTTLCTVQNNFTFTGVAELRLSSMNVVYSTDDVNIPTEVLNAYLNNEKTNRVLVTNFNDSETYKLFNTSTIAYIDIPDDVIVDTANITIVGGYS